MSWPEEGQGGQGASAALEARLIEVQGKSLEARLSISRVEGLLENSRRFSSETYLLNFGRRNTLSNSAIVASDTNNFPRVAAASNACRGTEREAARRRTATPVSITVRLSFIAKQRLQDFRGQATRLGVPADLVHDLLQRTGWASGSSLRRRRLRRSCSLRRSSAEAEEKARAASASTSRAMVAVAMIH